MGAESSLPNRTRMVSVNDEILSCTLRNNFHPLRFHPVHGENVKLFKDGAGACRSDGFCKGICFSDRPVQVNEPVYVKFVDVSSHWSGALRIGFTAHDPNNMRSKLPRYACPDLTSVGGNWAKALAERVVRKDAVLHYWVDQNGDVHFRIDNVEHGVIFGGVNTSVRLWAVLDIYGNTIAIEFIHPNSLGGNDDGGAADASSNQEDLCDISAILSQCLTPVAFHRVHGRNVSRPTEQSAYRKQGFADHAYVFTERPIVPGEKLLFRIDKIIPAGKTRQNLLYGITSCNPETISPYDLPENADDLLDRPEYWIVREDLSSHEKGDYIIYTITPDGVATVYYMEKRTRNNQAKFRKASEKFHIDLSQPLWLFFNIIGPVSGLCLMGSSDSRVTDITNEIENLSLLKTLELDSAGAGTSAQSTDECVICYQEAVNCVIYKCGHMCLCYSCAQKMWKPYLKAQCPICREDIQDIIKTFR